MANVRRPLSLYAERVGMTKEGARQWLIRVGIDYENVFDFDEADRRIEAARHANRTTSTQKAIDDHNDDKPVDPETTKNPLFIESQARREKFKADLTEIEYRKQAGQLILAEEVDKEWFRIGRLVRDTLKNIGRRLGAQLAAETDQFKCEQLVDEEVERALAVVDERVTTLEEVA